MGGDRAGRSITLIYIPKARRCCGSYDGEATNQATDTTLTLLRTEYVTSNINRSIGFLGKQRWLAATCPLDKGCKSPIFLSGIFDIRSTPYVCFTSSLKKTVYVFVFRINICGAADFSAFRSNSNDQYVAFIYPTMFNITHPMIGSVRLLRPKSGSQPLGEIPRTADSRCVSLSYPGGQVW